MYMFAAAFGILVLYILFASEIKEPIYLNLTNAMVPTFILGFILTALSKLGIIINIEDIAKEAQKNLGDLGDLIRGSTDHGLSGTEHPFDAINEIRDLKKNDTVYIMDTRIADTNIQTSLRNALEAGVSLKILVMHPDSEQAKYRFLDLDDSTSFDRYQRSLVNQKTDLDQLASEDKIDLEVNYTKEWITCPIFIAYSGSHEFAYTGYYLNNRAMEFPNVYWKSGKAGFLDKLKIYFDIKWNRAKKGMSIEQLIKEKEDNKVVKDN